MNVLSVHIGGNNPVVVQSMTNTDTRDVSATLKQINELHRAGCEIARLAVLNEDAVLAFSAIANNLPFPWLPIFTLTPAWRCWL